MQNRQCKMQNAGSPFCILHCLFAFCISSTRLFPARVPHHASRPWAPDPLPGNESYFRTPGLISTKSGLGVQIVTTHSRSRWWATCCTCSSVTAANLVGELLVIVVTEAEDLIQGRHLRLGGWRFVFHRVGDHHQFLGPLEPVHVHVLGRAFHAGNIFEHQLDHFIDVLRPGAGIAPRTFREAKLSRPGTLRASAT